MKIKWHPCDATILPVQSVKDFLQPQFKRGDLVEVSMDGKEWKKRIYLTTIYGAALPIIVVYFGHDAKFKRGEPFAIMYYKYIRPIQEPIITELTLKEIADKLGIPVEQLRIKD